jgi:RHS repeat-associated protein
MLSEADNNLNKTIAYTYDANGNRATMTDGENGQTTYAYDDADRLTSLTNPNSEQTTYTYDAAGRRIGRTYANGTYAAYHYDDANRLLHMADYRSTGDTICGFVYTYDNAGNRTAKVYANGDTELYGYDDLYQLTEVQTKEKQTTYEYDAVGNRLQLIDGGETTVYAYNAGNELLQFVTVRNTGDSMNPYATDTVTFAYDENGNQVTKTTDTEVWHYAFDENNMLISVTAETQGVSVQYVYIPDGRQTKQVANGTTTNYFHDGNNPLAEYDGGSQRTVRFTYNLLIDDIISAERGDSVSWYHKDGLGSVIALTDVNETTTDEYQYDPFGGIVWHVSNTDNNVVYTGRRLDVETEMFYMRSRFYCNLIGRFNSRDNYRDYIGNMYSYCNNQPVTQVDPNGDLSYSYSVMAWQRKNMGYPGLTRVEKFKITRSCAKQGIFCTTYVEVWNYELVMGRYIALENDAIWKKSNVPCHDATDYNSWNNCASIVNSTARRACREQIVRNHEGRHLNGMEGIVNWLNTVFEYRENSFEYVTKQECENSMNSASISVRNYIKHLMNTPPGPYSY